MLILNPSVLLHAEIEMSISSSLDLCSARCSSIMTIPRPGITALVRGVCFSSYCSAPIVFMLRSTFHPNTTRSYSCLACPFFTSSFSKATPPPPPPPPNPSRFTRLKENPSLLTLLCAKPAFLSWLRLSVYMAIVSCAIVISFHIRNPPSNLERRMALPLGLVFWLTSLASLLSGFATYVKSVTKYSRRQVLVQSGWKTQAVCSCFCCFSLAVVVGWGKRGFVVFAVFAVPVVVQIVQNHHRDIVTADPSPFYDGCCCSISSTAYSGTFSNSPLLLQLLLLLLLAAAARRSPADIISSLSPSVGIRLDGRRSRRNVLAPSLDR